MKHTYTRPHVACPTLVCRTGRPQGHLSSHGRRRVLVLAALTAQVMLLASCAMFRAADDAVSSTLENVPVLKALGIESRKSQQARANLATPASTATVEFRLTASDWLNPDAMLDPMPTRIRLFDMGRPERFLAASFSALLRDPASALAADYRASRDVILTPGQSETVNWTLQRPGYIGVFADYRAPSTSSPTSRRTVVCDAQCPAIVQIRLDGTSLAVEPINAASGTAVAGAYTNGVKPDEGSSHEAPLLSSPPGGGHEGATPSMSGTAGSGTSGLDRPSPSLFSTTAVTLTTELSSRPPPMSSANLPPEVSAAAASGTSAAVSAAASSVVQTLVPSSATPVSSGSIP